MSYVAFLTSTPYSWIVVCGLLTGIAVAGLTRVVAPSGKAKEGTDRARRRAARASQLTRVLFYLTGAVACIPAAVFFPGAEQILDSALPRFYVGASVAGFLIERFPRALGIPVVLFVVLAVVTGFGVLSAYPPVYGEMTVAELRALSVHEGSLRVELSAVDDSEHSLGIATLSGNAVAPVVSTVGLHPGWFVFGRELGYRVRGLDAYMLETQREVTDRFRIAEPEGRGGLAVRVLQAIAGRLPGITKSESVTAPQLMRSRDRYSVVLDAASGEMQLRLRE